MIRTGGHTQHGPDVAMSEASKAPHRKVDFDRHRRPLKILPEPTTGLS
jgi:hypothetical protein